MTQGSDILNIVRAVYDFNRLIIDVEGRPMAPCSIAEFDWMKKAFAEEIQEMTDAHAAQDIVKLVDGTWDLIYFAIGHLARMGVPEDKAQACFQAIHDANMTKKKGKVEGRGNFADDAAKPADFVPPDVRIGQILLGS